MQGDDSLRGSDRERRTLEQRLRDALTQDAEIFESPDSETPLELTDPVDEAPIHEQPSVAARGNAERMERVARSEPETQPTEPADDDVSPTSDLDGGDTSRPAASIWNRLPRIPVEPGRLERNLVITANRRDPAHGAFDVLRTKIVQATQERGWSRVGITSATAGSGKSFTAINLAISLSRLRNFNTILMDLDLRRPGLTRVLGLRDMPATADFLRGEIDATEYLSVFAPNLLNIGDRLALGINGREEPYASELLHNPASARRIAEMKAAFDADLIMFDMPPALAMDDVLAFRPHLDCVLMVVGGGETRAKDIREAQRRLGDDLPILGVVMNKAEIDDSAPYSYGY